MRLLSTRAFCHLRASITLSLALTAVAFAATAALAQDDAPQLEETSMVQTPEQRGREYMAQNAEREGVVTTESGLQYEVLKSGDGETPGRRDQVSVHYRGSFIDGRVFDSSIDRRQPAQFRVNGVIPGWTEALQLMPEGSKWELYVPSDLGYGPGGFGNIGPNETLVFEIELMAIKKAEQSSEGEG